ncbi:POP1-domain-containing protein [Neoconidiobolus thromboides FSU 785]|nr:POP1-domain-containing protein [Neoconidiobolus thromboides FSU 785]
MKKDKLKLKQTTLNNILTPIGVKVNTNRGIEIDKFVETRKNEIEQMEKTMKQYRKSVNKRAFQTLPRYLRRRTASHNCYRVPQRLREKTKFEISKDGLKIRKRSSRFKYYAKNRRLEYLKRQKNKTWLQTHIWHAKRMHMKVLWGYSLPIKATLKNYRTLYRYNKTKATIYDISYNSIIQLNGNKIELSSFLNLFLDPSELSVKSKRISTGKRMYSSMLYEKLSFPYNLLCPIKLIFQSTLNQTEPSSNNTKVWIIIHASCYYKVFNMFENEIRESESNIQLLNLKDKLNLFLLNGKNAAMSLSKALDPTESDDPKLGNSKYGQELFSLLQYPGLATTIGLNTIFSVTLLDPRLRGTPRKEKSIESYQITKDKQDRIIDLLLTHTDDLAYSKLWDMMENEEENKNSEKSINNRKSKLLLPKTGLKPTPCDNRIPIIIVKTSISSHPTSEKDNYLLITPSQWGRDLFKQFVFNSTLVMGLRDYNNLNYESKSFRFPNDYPMTNSYLEYIKDKKLLKMSKYLATSKAKRVNFEKLKVKYPFGPEFKSLTYYQQLRGEEIEGNRMGNKRKLKEEEGNKEDIKMENESDKVMEIKKNKLKNKGEETDRNIEEPNTAIITSLINLNSMFLLPNKLVSEVIKIKDDEQKLININKILDQSLKSYEFKREIQLNNQVNWDSGLIQINLEFINGASGKFKFGMVYMMNKNWLEIKKDETVKEKSNSANDIPPESDIIGYVTSSNYSLSEGNVTGMASILLKSLVELMIKDKRKNRKDKLLVLVRSTTSRVPKVARIILP